MARFGKRSKLNTHIPARSPAQLQAARAKETKQTVQVPEQKPVSAPAGSAGKTKPSADQIFEAIMEGLDNDDFFRVSTDKEYSHADDRHGTNEETSLLGRILQTEKERQRDLEKYRKNVYFGKTTDLAGPQYSSGFSTPAAAKEIFREIIKSERESIYEWLQDDSRTELPIYWKPEDASVIGYGFYHDTKKNSLIMCSTKAANLILRKNPDVPNYGIASYTYYPNIADISSAKFMKTNVQAILEQTKEWDGLSKYEKAYLIYASEYKNFNYNWEADYDKESMRISFPYGGVKHTLSISDEKINIRSATGILHPDFAQNPGRTFTALKEAFPQNENALKTVLKNARGHDQKTLEALFSVKPVPKPKTPDPQEQKSEDEENFADIDKDTEPSKF